MRIEKLQNAKCKMQIAKCKLQIANRKSRIGELQIQARVGIQFEIFNLHFAICNSLSLIFTAPDFPG
ncbi:MAG TPA: hypothetical protein VN937_25745 [Blastocatellia bacterium]|nr:hypothetical protein [Blastocatellia bacterium]